MVRKAIAKFDHSDHPTPVAAGVTISGVASPLGLVPVATSSAGVAANGLSMTPVFSPDGTKVLFSSLASNLVPGDTNGLADVFMRDLTTGLTTQISLHNAGIDFVLGFNKAVFSPDGTKVLYVSTDGGLFLKDLAAGTETVVAATATGEPGVGTNYSANFSPDGSKVAFYSTAANLVAGDNNGLADIFIKDLNTGAISRIPLDINIGPSSGSYGKLAYSPDGRKLAFTTDVDGLVPGDHNGNMDVFVLDLQTNAITLVSSSTSGGTGNSLSFSPVFSVDGNSIAFQSLASDLGAAGSPYGFSIYNKNLITGATTVVSTDGNGQPIAGYLSDFIYSPDGKLAAFVSSGGLVPGTAGQSLTVYIKDLVTGALSAIPGAFPDGYVNGGNYSPSFSSDSSSITFSANVEYINNGVVSENYGVFVYKIGGAVIAAGEVITGSVGIDTATYETSHASVKIDLTHSDGSANLGDALKDTYVSIENFKLTNFDDTFISLNTVGAKNSASGLDGADTFTSGGKGTTNTFDGGNGNDTFLGGAGTDKFTGGAGDDHLTGGGGKDVLTGGTGADTFIFNLKEKGAETITDFELGIDHLQFTGISARNVSVHLEHGSVEIEIDHGATIVLNNVTDVNAVKHDMLFV